MYNADFNILILQDKDIYFKFIKEPGAQPLKLVDNYSFSESSIKQKTKFDGGRYMELIMQPTFSTCGQACIAMIVGKSVDEVIKDMKTDAPTSIGQLIEILDFYGVRHADRNKRISKKNPVPYKCSILTVHTHSGYTHWVLLHNNKYYDPEFGLIEGEYIHGKITSFLEIYVD